MKTSKISNYTLSYIHTLPKVEIYLCDFKGKYNSDIIWKTLIAAGKKKKKKCSYAVSPETYTDTQNS